MDAVTKLFLTISAFCLFAQTLGSINENKQQDNLIDLKVHSDKVVNDEPKTPKNVDEMKLLLEDLSVLNDASRKAGQKKLRKLDRDILSIQIHGVSDTLLKLNDLLKQDEDCHKFLKLNGVETAIIQALQFPNDNVKGDALFLLRTLFECIPETARSDLPDGVLEKILDTFEHVGSFPVKKRALDVLKVWLPNNPATQAKVMMMRGIEPFYKQIGSLDVETVNDLFDLFIDIVKEHVKVMKSGEEKTEQEIELAKAYANVGLLKEISSKKICYGIAEILDNVWEGRELHIPQVCRLLQLMKPFCLRKLKGKHNYLEFFEEIEEFVANDVNKNYFDNVTEVKEIIQAYKKSVTQRSEL